MTDGEYIFMCHLYRTLFKHSFVIQKMNAEITSLCSSIGRRQVKYQINEREDNIDEQQNSKQCSSQSQTIETIEFVDLYAVID